VKKNLLVVLSVVLVFSLMFVGTSLANTQYRVAYIARAQADSFAAWLANSIVEEANKYDHITVRVFDGQADNAQQNALIENAIVNGYDLIIIQPNDGEAQRPYAELVVESGIHLITTNARIDGVEGASSVDADPYMQAAVVAEMALEQVPQNANVVVLNGPPGNFHASERRKAWEAEFFQKRKDVKIVGEQIANWNKDEAMRYMEDWVQANDRIDAIISMNDNMAAGALEVIKNDPDFDNILAYGVDGTVEAALLIQEGKMTATTLQSAYDLAERILWVSDLLLRGEVFEIHTDIGNPVITLENVEETLEMHRQAGNL